MRLREEIKATNPDLAAAAELLRAASPLDSSGAMERRVRARLAQSTRGAQRSRVLRSLVAAMMVFGCTSLSIAGAMVGRDWVRERRATHPPTRVDTSLAPSPRTTERKSTRAPTPVVERSPLSHPAAPPARLIRRPIAMKPPVAGTEPPPALDDPAFVGVIDAPATRLAPSPEEASLMMEAVKALRIGSDASSAGRLLDEYLTRYPAGALVEEAMAFAIEAAAGRNDPRTSVLAQRYLARFPTGRFRETALNAQKRFGR